MDEKERLEEGKKAEQAAKGMLEKYDRESQFREKIGRWSWVVAFLGIALTIFHLYAGYFGTIPSQQQNAVHLDTDLGLIFLLYSLKSRWQKKQKTMLWYD